MFARALELALLHKLIVVELREEDRLVRIVKRETEAAFRSDISQLLIEGLIPVELVHVLIHVNLRITTFPGT